MRHLLFCLAVAIGTAPLAAAKSPADIEQVKRELEQFARDFYQANLKKDAAVLDRLLAEEFVWVHAFGYADDKTTVIAEAMEDPAKPTLRVPQFTSPNRLYVSGNLAVTMNPNGGTATGSRAWATAVYIRRDGRWQLLQRQGTELNPTPHTVPLTNEALARYVGTYALSDRRLKIEMRPDGLYSISDRFPPRRMFPVGPDLFTTKVGGNVLFGRDSVGGVSRVTFSGRGPDRTYARIR